MEYSVSRSGTSLVTLHEGTDTTACRAARAEVTDGLAERGDDAITDWSITDTSVYEHPSAPFDPYTITVSFEVTATVDAPDADEAERAGTAVIEATLDAIGLDAITYTAPAAATAD